MTLWFRSIPMDPGRELWNAEKKLRESENRSDPYYRAPSVLTETQ